MPRGAWGPDDPLFQFQEGAREAEALAGSLSLVSRMAQDSAEKLKKNADANDDGAKKTKELTQALNRHANAFGIQGHLLAGVQGSFNGAGFGQGFTRSVVGGISSTLGAGALEIGAAERAGQRTFSFLEDAVRNGAPLDSVLALEPDIRQRFQTEEDRLVPFQREFTRRQTLAENAAFANSPEVADAMDAAAAALNSVADALRSAGIGGGGQ